MRTIEPDIQEAILDILPSDDDIAIRLVCQLLANMILSINGANINDAINEIKINLDEYQGT